MTLSLAFPALSSAPELLAYSALAALAIYLLLGLFSRVSGGPKFAPGPKPWPIVGNLPHLGPRPHHALAALARKYGPLMHLKLGFVDVVVAASATTAAQFLKVHDANFSNRPPNSGAKHIAYNYQDMVFAPYGPRWRMLRKVCQVHLFSNKALDDFRQVRESEIAVLTRKLAGAGKSGTPINLAKALNICTTNALARVMLGKRVFSEDSSAESDEFKDMVVEMMVLAGVFNIGDFIPSLEWLDLQGVARKMKKLHARFDKFLGKFLEEHRARGAGGGGQEKHADFLTVLLQQDDTDGEGGKLTDIEIKALLLNMFTAGTDTSSSTVEWAIAELIRHPKLLSQAQQEIDSVLGRDRLVSELDIAHLPFLQAIVKETFRLHPSTPLSLPRMAAESCEIDGYHVPKGATLLVNVWAISRDPEAWEEPLEFRPGRFMPGGERPNADVRGTDFEVIPFGAGRRICAGMSLGIRVVQLVTATLVHAFDWELPAGQSVEKLDMEEAYGLTLQRNEPLVVHPRPRLSPHAYI
uniref:Flavonoid 3'-hydroxylase n=1 Tax=Kalanchoe fedtschenkoi TaxID=63787 RepID=A0A7N0TN66_KALFE